jgi:ribose transport system substrate-binding protein
VLSSKILGKVATLVAPIALVACACTSAAATPAPTATPAPSVVASASPVPASVSGDFTNCAAGKKIGIILLNNTLQLFLDMQKSGNEVAQAYGFTPDWQSADGSLDKQITIMDQMIAQKYDVIAVNPVNSNAITAEINKATAAGIKVVSVAANVAASGNVNTLYNDYANFSLLAQVMGTSLNGKGNVLYLYGTIGNYASDQRAKGFTETMTAKFPNIKVTSQETKNNASTAVTIVQSALAGSTSVDGIATNDGALNVAILPILKAAGKDAAILQTANTGLTANTDLVNSGVILADVATGNFRIGAWNVGVAGRMACGAKFDNNLYMYSPLIMADATAAKLKTAGLDLTGKYITEAAAQTFLAGYVAEFGPKAPATSFTAATVK